MNLDIDSILSIEEKGKQQEKDLYQQEQKLQEQVQRKTYENESNTLLGAFLDNLDQITGGYDSVLPTPEDTTTPEETLEPSSVEPISKPKSKPKKITIRAPKDIVEGISDLNLQDRTRA